MKIIKTPEEILRKLVTHIPEFGFGILIDIKESEVLSAMEEYAEQFKYDYSQECKCDYSPGSTWCCNLCGLPTNEQTQINN